MPDLPRDAPIIPTGEGGAHVIVTIESIYTLLVGVRDDVRDLKTRTDDVRDDIRDHESRLRSVERKVWLAAGVASAVGAGLAQLIPAVGG